MLHRVAVAVAPGVPDDARKLPGHLPGSRAARAEPARANPDEEAPIQVQTAPNPYNGPTRHYEVHIGDDVQLIAGRAEAIRKAKEASRRRGRVRVEGRDTPVEIHFVGGQVAKYRLETRRTKRSRRDS